ncbi:M14 family metallopeptidase [Acinetobacter soli]|uniref:M14 family metallopeptidase n=1 Tax=Acinetobacter soli TaxID=487316 RepID=UPI001250C7A9|nr:M14 family metallopeptidase [Acinetobacter soli]
MPLPNIYEFIGTNVTEGGFKSAFAIMHQFLKELEINVQATKEGMRGYATISSFEADKLNVPTDTTIRIAQGDDAGLYIWDGVSLVLVDESNLYSQAINYSNTEFSKLNQMLVKKIDVNLDFYTYSEHPSFIQLNEFNQIIGTGTDDADSLIKYNSSRIDLIDSYLKATKFILFDFYTDQNISDFIQINEANQIIGTGTTEKDIYVYDFYTFNEYPDLLFVDSKMKVLNASSSNDFDKLPDSEADANSLYFNENTLKRVRAYSSMYNQLNAEVIPDFQAQRVYDFFDNLMSNNPSYITKSSLGFSTRGVEMFTYKFTPPSRRVGNGSTLDQIKPVRIMMNAGIHGSEKHGIIATMCFADNLVNNWRELEHYDALRLNCEFYISPMMNIDGTNYNTRTNANGVDCNRNFDWNWSTADNSINKGSAPFSEIESRNYRDLVLNSNCDAYLDIHHGGENEIIWLGSNIDENLKLLSNAATEITTHFLKNINPSVDPQTQLVYLPRNGDGTACGWMCANNKSGFLCEGIGTGNPYILTTLNARKVNEAVLLKVVNQIFNRVTLRKELSI